MSISLHNLKKSKGLKKSAKRLGRGYGSTTGTTAGRGQKGQKARSGTSGFKRMALKRTLLATPKLRGFKSLNPEIETVNIKDLALVFGKDEVVTPKSLKKKELISNPLNGAKILGQGDIDHAIVVQGCTASKSAIEKITKAGGSFKA